MDRKTKNAILYRFVRSLEKDHGSITNASKTNDVRFKNMRTFVDENFTHESEEKEVKYKRSEPQHRWTEYEKSYLKKHYPTTDTRKIAKTLGIKYQKVQVMAGVLKLKKSKNDRNEKIEFIKENHKKMKPIDMAESLGITQAGVGYYMKKLGLR